MCRRLVRVGPCAAALCLFASTLLSGRGIGLPAQAEPGGRPEKILFVSNREGPAGNEKGKYSIFTMNPDGSGQAKLSKGDALEFDPTWSPDGKQVAFAAMTGGAGSKSGIYVMNADGSDRRQIIQSEGDAAPFAPSWSPDGKQIAYSRLEFKQDAKSDLYVVDADGKNPKRLGEGLMPVWSPDGSKILYTVLGAQNGEPRLFTMDAGGGNAKPLSKPKAMMGAWSPDGKRIAYMAEGGGNQPDIFVMNADGSKPTQLTKTPDLEFTPQWSPDGKQVFFTRIPKDANGADKGDIYVMGADGKNSRRLTTTGFNFLGGGFVLFTGRDAPAAPEKQQ
jgi:TolB protein